MILNRTQSFDYDLIELHYLTLIEFEVLLNYLLIKPCKKIY